MKKETIKLIRDILKKEEDSIKDFNRQPLKLQTKKMKNQN